MRADQAGIGIARERVEQRVQPARLRNGVVVQQHDVLPATQAQAVIAGGDEAAVLWADVIPQAFDLRHPLGGGVAAAVVDHQDFAISNRRVRGQRPQAGQRMRAMVVDRDDDAGPGAVAGGHAERREGAAGRLIQRLTTRWRLLAGMHAHPVQGGAPAAGAQAGQTATDQADDAFEVVMRVGQ
ncbi:hypothetical protein D3C81_1260290 [compost metagenome]